MCYFRLPNSASSIWVNRSEKPSLLLVWTVGYEAHLPPLGKASMCCTLMCSPWCLHSAAWCGQVHGATDRPTHPVPKCPFRVSCVLWTRCVSALQQLCTNRCHLLLSYKCSGVCHVELAGSSVAEVCWLLLQRRSLRNFCTLFALPRMASRWGIVEAQQLTIQKYAPSRTAMIKHKLHLTCATLSFAVKAVMWLLEAVLTLLIVQVTRETADPAWSFQECLTIPFLYFTVLLIFCVPYLRSVSHILLAHWVNWSGFKSTCSGPNLSWSCPANICTHSLFGGKLLAWFLEYSDKVSPTQSNSRE